MLTLAAGHRDERFELAGVEDGVARYRFKDLTTRLPIMPPALLWGTLLTTGDAHDPIVLAVHSTRLLAPRRRDELKAALRRAIDAATPAPTRQDMKDALDAVDLYAEDLEKMVPRIRYWRKQGYLEGPRARAT